MYRDDKDAADALAAQLARDNADLEAENARLKDEHAKLKAELAARPPARKNKKQKKQPKPNMVTATPGRPPPPAIVRGKVYNWTVRVACGAAVAVASFLICRATYPVFNRGIHAFWGPVFVAVLNQIWSILFIAQPILGWWPDADKASGIEAMTLRSRVGSTTAGIVAVVVTALFAALVGESSGGV